mmetsp:Transcript_93952/g.201634  ORF Transcript_93952/g.201634 Transcript_93952/m.201634 type:complete len:268 (-) Transcript_93952:823-1626(-)
MNPLDRPRAEKYGPRSSKALFLRWQEQPLAIAMLAKQLGHHRNFVSVKGVQGPMDNQYLRIHVEDASQGQPGESRVGQRMFPLVRVLCELPHQHILEAHSTANLLDALEFRAGQFVELVVAKDDIMKEGPPDEDGLAGHVQDPQVRWQEDEAIVCTLLAAFQVRKVNLANQLQERRLSTIWRPHKAMHLPLGKVRIYVLQERLLRAGVCERQVRDRERYRVHCESSKFVGRIPRCHPLFFAHVSALPIDRHSLLQVRGEIHVVAYIQ